MNKLQPLFNKAIDKVRELTGDEIEVIPGQSDNERIIRRTNETQGNIFDRVNNDNMAVVTQFYKNQLNIKCSARTLTSCKK